MQIELKIAMNQHLFIKDPEGSELGRKILFHAVEMIQLNGFEDFTFKKLAKNIGTTEAGIYRYFENKHRLLTYLTAWYWSWLEYQIHIQTKNIKDPKSKLKIVIMILMMKSTSEAQSLHINEQKLHQIIITEGVKAYLTHHVSEDNKIKLFKPYKDLCASISHIILENNKNYTYPKSLASTIIENSHLQVFFNQNLPSLTDYSSKKNDKEIISFLEHLVFSCLKIS